METTMRAYFSFYRIVITLYYIESFLRILFDMTALLSGQNMNRQQMR